MADPVEALLHYLHSHTYEQAKAAFPEHIKHISDVGGLLNLEFLNPTTIKTLTITTNGIPGGFKADTGFKPIPDTNIQPVNSAKGTFFIRGGPPTGQSKFWLVQYPPNPQEKVGRTVIEFYTENKITAVFKTDNDNYGGSGTGNWL